MNFSENIRIALSSVRSNLLRAILTLLIIAFGITALVGILTAIDAAVFSLSDNLSQLGANSFSVYPKRDGIRGNRRGRSQKAGEVIDFDQAVDFKERFRFPATVSLSLNATGSAVIGFEQEETNPTTSVVGIDEHYLALNGFELSLGRNFSPGEVSNGANKVILGTDIVKALFDNKEDRAIDQIVSIGSARFKVIGVLKSKGASMGRSEDRQVLIPILTAKRFYGSPSSNYGVAVGVAQATEIDNAVSTAIGLMRKVRGLKASEANDFDIFKSDSLVDIIKENTTNLRLGAVVIGLITLLGAAIGLMNIMLVSVTERTREIGIRKALGATRQNILIQFLTEAVVICQMGGLIGIFFGILIGYGVASLMNGSFQMPWMWITIAIITCIVVGLLSGLYPALKAARLDPIESLRYE